MNDLRKRCIRLCLITAGILTIGLLIYMLARVGIPIPCIFNKITGLSCPGCGNTRAVLALLRLDIGAAFSYNLLFPVGIVYLFFVYIHCAATYLKTGQFAYHSPAPVLDWCILGILLLWWVVRNILHI